MRAPPKGQGNKIDPAKTDVTAALSDTLLQRILLLLPESARADCGLVCHRWLRIVGELHRKLRLRDWEFLESGRLAQRFPHLTDVDLTWASIRDVPRKTAIILGQPHLVLPVYPLVTREDKPFSLEACIQSQQLTAESQDRGLEALASGCPDLKRLRLVDVSNNHGLGGSFSEWEFVSANDRTGHKQAVKQVRDGENGEKLVGDEEKVKRDGGLEHGGGGGGVEEPGRNGSRNNDEGFMKSLEDNADGVKNITANADDSAAEAKNVVISKVGGGVVTTAEADLDGELGGKKGGGQGGKGSKQAEAGIVSLARGCTLLQELEVHQCTDETVTAVVACQNVQTLRLVGTVPGFSNCSFTDIGLTILANRCRRLMRLELSGCEASFAGIAAIGQCCFMLEELTLSSTGFQGGWVAALGFFESLKTLRLERCKYIDRSPDPAEHIQCCHTLERLQLLCCDLRDRAGFAALLTVCADVRELEFQDCWGLDDESFALAANCRKLRLLSLDGCSLVTAAGLEAVAFACKELQRLRVVYCENIRDAEISPDFGDVVVMLKEFRWRPDTKSQLSSTNNAIAQQGRWFFKKS